MCSVAVNLKADLNSVARGEVLGFLGPNGAGKTTTLRLVTGFLRPSSGTLRLLGCDLQRPREAQRARRRLGYVPDVAGLDPAATGARLLDQLAALQGQPPIDQAQLCTYLDLQPHDLQRPIGRLSRGTRQKINLVQAMQHRPDLLILDEPTEGLDPLGKQALFDLLRAAHTRGATIFFSSHVLSEVEELCDRVALIRGGRLIAVDRIADLRRCSAYLPRSPSTISRSRRHRWPMCFCAITRRMPLMTQLRAALLVAGATLRRKRSSLLAFAIAIGVFQYIVAASYPTIGGTAAVDSVIRTFPPDLKRLLRIAPNLQAGFGLQDYLALGFFHPVFLGLGSAFVVGRATDALAGEIERGSIYLLLSRPVRRWTIVLGKMLELSAGAGVLALVVWLGVALGAWSAALPPVPLDRYFVTALVAWALFVALGAGALLISACGSTTGRVVGIGTGRSLVSFVLDVLPAVAESPFAWLNPWHHYDPQAIAATGWVNPWGIAVLRGCSLIGRLGRSACLSGAIWCNCASCGGAARKSTRSYFRAASPFTY